MKVTVLGIIALILFGCNQEKMIKGELILRKSIIEHDSLNSWDKANLHIHIQEPRISNPYRYSLLKLDNSTNSFELSRNRDQHISKHIIDPLGNSFVLLDGKTNIDTALIKKYRLDASRNIGYKSFYELLYGLPMSLDGYLKQIINTSEEKFNSEDCYKMEVELKEPVISKYWNLYVSRSNMRLEGIEIVFPDKPDDGERIYFDGIIVVNGIKIPRMRHWHELKDDTYSGSDLIIKELTE